MKLPRPFAAALLACGAIGVVGSFAVKHEAAAHRMARWEAQQAWLREEADGDSNSWSSEYLRQVRTLPQPGLASVAPSEWVELIRATMLRRGSSDPFSDPA